MKDSVEPYGQRPPGAYDGQPRQPGVYGPAAQPGVYGPPGQPGAYGGPLNQPPYGQPSPYGYGYAPPGSGRLADWGSRAVASVIDSVLVTVPVLIGFLGALVVDGGSEQLGAAGGILIGAGCLGSFALWLWNRVIRQGRTGQSAGKQVMGLQLVAESTGQVLGTGRAFGREVMSAVINNACFLNCLWPLWDDKQQTLHDKVVSAIVVKL